MEINLTSARRPAGDLLLACRFEDERASSVLEADAGEAFAEAARRCSGKTGSWAEAALGRRTLRVDGVGKRKSFDRRALRAWIAGALARARARGARRPVLVLPEHDALAAPEVVDLVVATVEGASYRFDTFRGGENGAREQESLPEKVALVVGEAVKPLYDDGLDAAVIVARAVSWARDLGNTPPNVATPEWMAAEARRMAKERSVRATVLGPKQLAEKKMGGLVAVGGGSENGPRLVRLSSGRRGPKVTLVGKGVTFDTGGISIKPSPSMEEMKYDKCGACAVLGIARAVAELDLPIRLTSIVALAENMPDGRAYRPGDIVRCYDGSTVEILNTDAEGRMILADALAWAREDEPDVLVDYATLTGACVVALGEGAAGLFSADDELADALLGAAALTEDRLWRLPLWPEFAEQMKGTHADLRNAGGSRWGGACTAAGFLSHFADGPTPWAHVDLAGPAYSASKPVLEGMAGATGYGVAFTLRWLRGMAEQGKS